jgi:hypothetical protein
MLKPPRDAQEAFNGLAPDLEELKDFVSACPLTSGERARLVNLLADYFVGLAGKSDAAGLPDEPSVKLGGGRP